MQRNDAGNNLVKLELVDVMDIDPMPDKAMQGRLTRMLKQVGAEGTIAVRARMITTVSNTKFKTHGGHPISLVGLHGKDELLVRGPDWAIEQVGRGRSPSTAKCISQLKEQEHRFGEFSKMIDGSEKLDSRFDEIGNALKAANKLGTQAKSELKQKIAELLVELSEMQKIAQNGEIPWWYFWTTWWTKKIDHFRLEIEGKYYFQMTLRHD